MSATVTPLPAPPPVIRPVRSVVSPLLPVVLPLVFAAIGLSVVFAWLFPPGIGAATRELNFTDVTAESGLQFTHQQGGGEAPTTLAGAVAVLDYNSDGAPDLFFVNGAPWPWEESPAKRLVRSSALFRNDGRGRFTDVTAAAGLNGEMQGMGVTAGDFDNDGHPDLFVTCLGLNHLFRNLGNGRFEDVTEQAGVGGDENTWSTGAAWLDDDGDGRLDLMVLHYARWPREVPLAQAFVIADIGRSYGAPTGFVSAFPSVYRNLGDGRFVLQADSAGLRDLDPETGRPVPRPLAIAPLNANGDGRLDLLVTHHNHGPALFLARGDGTFERQTARRSSRQEGAAASFASASAFSPGTTADPHAQILSDFVFGVRVETPRLNLDEKLGIALADFDLDGQTEIFSGSGRAELHLNKFAEGRDFAVHPDVLGHYKNHWSGRMPRVDARVLVARGVAAADFDGDGDADVVIAQNNGPAVLLRNDQRHSLPWLRLQLVATRSQPEAGGARVEVHTPRRVFTQTVAPTLGFMAQSESILTFGLGEDARVRKIVIQWPSGQTQELRPDALNRTLVIREP